ncbi:MAG: hypothetical protein DI565_18460 [Ancylobacter novellus]|uniref:Uncharacterized protein n=1 Tax=Ancylobacter novellus TaxID=921 RepID=A0A2W5K5N8_ANCNO|nr:MAG: hypothetical protein DI565_18460 [Ancylobacter novellus]
MTSIKKALDRARPDENIFETDTGSSGVLIAVLALIFAPIILAHAVSLADDASAQTAPERPAVTAQAPGG